MTESNPPALRGIAERLPEAVEHAMREHPDVVCGMHANEAE